MFQLPSNATMKASKSQTFLNWSQEVHLQPPALEVKRALMCEKGSYSRRKTRRKQHQDSRGRRTTLTSCSRVKVTLMESKEQFRSLSNQKLAKPRSKALQTLEESHILGRISLMIQIQMRIQMTAGLELPFHSNLHLIQHFPGRQVKLITGGLCLNLHPFPRSQLAKSQTWKMSARLSYLSPKMWKATSVV